MAKHKRKCRKESGAIKRDIGEKQEHLERERERERECYNYIAIQIYYKKTTDSFCIAVRS
jgi:hypothetical protein